MATSLPLEFSKFNKNCRYLKRILNGTFSAIRDIVNSGKFYEEQINSGFHLDELNQIDESLHNKSLCILVCGQNRYAKAVVINELFNQPILPVITEWDRNQKWRTVRFQYGIYSEISLSLPNSYELVEHLQVSEKSWCTVPETDLEIQEEAQKDPSQNNAVLEIRLRHPLLKEDVQVVMAPCKNGCMNQLVTECVASSLPILIYAIGTNSLSEEEIKDLSELKQLLPNRPVFFIRTHPPPSPELTESEQHAQMASHRNSTSTQQTDLSQNSLNIFQQLCDIGYMSMLPSTTPKIRRRSIPMEVDNELVENFDNMSSILLFVRHVLQAYLVNVSSDLHDYHNKCLRMFIVSAFDMARDMMITPKRLVYAREKESELFNTLLGIANRKQDEIRDLITATITNMKEQLLEKAMNYEFKGVVVPQSGEVSTARELKICTGEIQDLILGTLNNAVANKLIGSVEYLRESFIGTLERCLESLENAYRDEGESLQARAALKQILNAAYQVEVTTKTSSSFMRCLWEKMKQVIQGMPWKTPPRIDAEWKRRVAADMINSLSESRLARSICSQFRDKLRQSHESFSASLRQLEAHHSGRLEKTEEERLKVRKCLAPRIARYALESTCLRDMLLYGMPQLGREIGRGQYGVVYACDSWGGYSPCALKSVVPPDEKHWNDLAMEFFYTQNVPEHDRVVALRGAVIDVSYGGGTSPAVLLIMDRLQRDLNSALKSGLDWLTRLQVSLSMSTIITNTGEQLGSILTYRSSLQLTLNILNQLQNKFQPQQADIAIDVVQGIRFLHSQGLIHRDIKLKNVLLDKKNRAKITDLGFCKPEAMMSGSIVGTPIHMAPELFSGKYDSTVDVYAFGILFWNVCAGHVRMPYIYEQCQNKDHLWTAVKKGARPEKLTVFDEECWNIMQECWAEKAQNRPLLGNVEQSLMAILERYRLCPTNGFDIFQTEYHAGSLSTSPYIDVELSPT